MVPAQPFRLSGLAFDARDLFYDATRKEARVTAMALKQQHDPDIHKGAIEGDRPGDEQIGNPHGDGINEDGLPDDPIAIAEDVEGANEDQSQG